MIKDTITKALQVATGLKDITLEPPENEEFGDYSSNIALQMTVMKDNKEGKGEVKKSSKETADEVVSKLKSDEKLSKIIERIEVAGPGFINVWLNKDVLINNLIQIDSKKENYGKVNDLQGKKYLLEHTSPNTIKTLHVGHVRNNITGMAVHNILEYAGAEVKLDAINNDRGIHVMKAIWAYMKYGQGKKPEVDKEKPDHFVDKFYQMGAKEAEENTQSREEMQELLRRWEAEDGEVREIWKKLRDWTLEGFEETYGRLGSRHDHQWFESDFYQYGKDIVSEGLQKKVFKKLPDGAVLTDLQAYKLPDTIILRADGTSMYHTQDLYLTKLKREKFPSDLYIWDVGPEQKLYLKQLFAMCEQLGIGKISDYFHLSFGIVDIKGTGKMSSRAGNVISADWLIDEIVKKAGEIINKSETGREFSVEEKGKISEMVGLGAIKYGFLKLARETDINFDIRESLSLEGNSGPYLQYTYARSQSVLTKSKRGDTKKEVVLENLMNQQFNNEELSLMKTLYRFPEIISMSAKNYSPNILCNYLYDLAQKFNVFYNKHGILEERTKSKEITEYRLFLTSATGQILKNGLNLLGIDAPEKM
ncbi:MAG TPA: arginine--tRNA ligase [Candidatus Humimicrobiaceae bacterium]|nr:arginine--tRNA ligase [Candidatus Humimicrobiaceae bacterium]